MPSSRQGLRSVVRALSALAFGLFAAQAAAAPLKVVTVGAPAIHCLFDPSCTVVVQDTATALSLPGVTGTAFLQSRTFQGAAGSPASGRYAYEYRIDLREAAGTDGPVCIRSLSLSFGSPGMMDYDGDGVGGDQVFVITEGGLGSVGPRWVDLSKKIVTFFFDPGVCSGADGQEGQSTFFMGLTSGYQTQAVTATVKVQAALLSVAAVGPKHPKLDLPGIKSGFIPPACGLDPVSSPGLLDCWLTSFPAVAQAIRWEMSDGSGVVPWSSWSAARRAQLRAAFLHAWVWLENGMTGFGGTPLPEPLPNQEVLADDAPALTVLDENTEAWPLYLAEVAQSLAIELRGWVPWSLRSYDADSLGVLLSGDKQFIFDTDVPGSPNDSVFHGYLVKSEAGGWVTPAHPTVTLTFLRDQVLVGGSRHQSIAQLLDWSRWNLLHFSGDFTTGNLEAQWQYRGEPPVSRIIEGTYAPSPPPLPPHFAHWTAGCHGTTDFLKSVLRSVNIPVFKHSLLATNHSTCGHATPYFASEARYLSHGDDPYDSSSKGHPPFPADLLLIDQAQYDAWFQVGQDACANVGRRPAQLLLQYLSNELVDLYCADVAAGLGHASGSVAAQFGSYYSVSELEAAGLWVRLSQRAQALGKCN